MIALHQWYVPVQPTVWKVGDAVNYVEIRPTVTLQPFIACYWELKTVEKLGQPFTYRVVADGCIDLFFELQNPEESFIMGFCKGYTEFPLSNSFRYLGVRFLPTVFPQWFGVNAAELSDRFLPLADVVPQLAAFIANHFSQSLHLGQIGERFDDCFTKVLSRIGFNYDSRLYNAIQLIVKNAGVLSVEKDLATGRAPANFGGSSSFT